MTDQEKAYFSLRKYFVSLQHKLTRYKIAGLDPPDYLKEKFEDTKRKIQIFDKARKNL